MNTHILKATSGGVATASVKISGLRRWRLECVTVNNQGGGAVNGVVEIAFKVRGIVLWIAQTTQILAGAVRLCTFAPGVTNIVNTTDGLELVSMPSLTIDGGRDPLDGELVVTQTSGDVAFRVDDIVCTVTDRAVPVTPHIREVK